MTVTGKTLGENLELAKPLPHGQDVIRPLNNPIKSTGHIRFVLPSSSRSLANSHSPASCAETSRLADASPRLLGRRDSSLRALRACLITRTTSPRRLRPSRSSRVRRRSSCCGTLGPREDLVSSLTCAGESEGADQGVGMPEMLKTTSMVIGAGLGQDVACVTDGRFSGGTHGFTVGHVVPVRCFLALRALGMVLISFGEQEAQQGGPIGLVQDGDVRFVPFCCTRCRS